MTPEEKELLLKDLCARLPYGLYTTVRDPEEKDECGPFDILGVKGDLVWVKNDMLHIDHFESVEVVKPYLRPMSSMTKDEREEYFSLSYPNNGIEDNPILDSEATALIDWLNSHHFDYRGLIEKGLALEAPEGMYN